MGGFNPTMITFGGQKWPDIVGALHVKQGWGEAQVSGVLHNVNVTDTANNSGTDCGAALTAGVFSEGCDRLEQSKVGWGVDAGVKVNLPSFGAGDNFLVTGSYTQSAVWYSGLPDGMWGEDGEVNGNGQPMYHVRRVLQSVDQPVVVADRVVSHGPDRASLHAAVLC